MNVFPEARSNIFLHPSLIPLFMHAYTYFSSPFILSLASNLFPLPACLSHQTPGKAFFFGDNRRDEAANPIGKLIPFALLAFLSFLRPQTNPRNRKQMKKVNYERPNPYKLVFVFPFRHFSRCVETNDRLLAARDEIRGRPNRSRSTKDHYEPYNEHFLYVVGDCICTKVSHFIMECRESNLTNRRSDTT